MNPKYFEEAIFFATLRIDAVDPTSGRTSVGSGFLVLEPIPDGRGTSILTLVTCRHVLFDGKGLVTLRLHRRRADGADGAELGTTISLGPAIYTDVYRAHPNPDVDIALINVSGVFAGIEGLYHRNIGRSMWADFADDRLIPALEIIFVGYPFGLYDQKNNLPILRAGRIASHPRADFDGKPEYIIDAQVFPGSSGSPVFVALGGEFKFAGVVGKTHFQDEQLGTVPAALAQTYRQYVGLGVVYKPEAVTDLLKSMAREFLSCAP